MQRSYEQVRGQVSREISRALGVDGEVVLQPMQASLATLGLDSLKLVEVVYELETFYQLDVDEERLAQLNSVGDLIELFVSELTGTGDRTMRDGRLDSGK